MHTREKKRHKEGQSLVEMSLALPSLILLVLVVVEVAFFARVYMGILEGSREGARLGARGQAFFDNSEIQTLVEQDLARQGFTTSNGLADVIIVRARLGPGVTINDYNAFSMLGSGRPVALTQAVLLSRMEASDTGGRIVAVEIYHDHDPILWGTPITIHTYSIMPVTQY